MQGTARLQSMSSAQARTLYIVLHHGVACKLVPAVPLVLVAVQPGKVNEMLSDLHVCNGFQVKKQMCAAHYANASALGDAHAASRSGDHRVAVIGCHKCIWERLLTNRSPAVISSKCFVFHQQAADSSCDSCSLRHALNLAWTVRGCQPLPHLITLAHEVGQQVVEQAGLDVQERCKQQPAPQPARKLFVSNLQPLTSVPELSRFEYAMCYQTAIRSGHHYPVKSALGSQDGRYC